MKLILNEELRVIGFTRDPLFTDFHAETSDLPKLSEDQSLSDYKFIDGLYLFEPTLAPEEESTQVNQVQS